MLKVTFQNKNDCLYEKLFNNLILEGFGFSFFLWHQLNIWDERYESYSIIEDGLMVANVSVFKTDLVFAGKVIRAHQLGAVVTREKYRGKGYAQRLLNHIFNIYPQTPSFLFANKDVLNFYPRFAFKRIYASIPRVDFIIDNLKIKTKALKKDDVLLKDFVLKNRQSSQLLYCKNTDTIELFHFVMAKKEARIYYLNELKALVWFDIQGEELDLLYLSAPKNLDFKKIAQQLPVVGVKKVRFYFMPDRFNLPIKWELSTSDDEAMFVKGDLPFPKQFVFPLTSKT